MHMACVALKQTLPCVTHAQGSFLALSKLVTRGMAIFLLCFIAVAFLQEAVTRGQPCFMPVRHMPFCALEGETTAARMAFRGALFLFFVVVDTTLAVASYCGVKQVRLLFILLNLMNVYMEKTDYRPIITRAP